MSDIRNILIINVSRIGDTLFATPAIRALASRWPDARVTILAHPNRAEVLAHLPYAHHVGSITKNSARFRGRLPGKSYDLAVVFGFDEALVAYALRAARRVVAFRQKNEALNRKLWKSVAPPAFQSEHAVVQLLRLAEAAGAKPVGLRLDFALQQEERRWAEARLTEEGLAGRWPLIGLQVASFPTKGYRDWPVENFAELCTQVIARWPDAGFLIFGGPEEVVRTDWLKQRLGDRAALLAGRLTLRQTAAMMSLADVYVGVDTGPTHIMSTFDIPIVGLYHCVSTRADTGPLEHPFDFCIDHPAAGACRDPERPMAEITVDTVTRQIAAALAARKSPPGGGA